jgi:hypothetical protein
MANQPFRPVVPQNGHAIPAFNSERDKRGGHFADLLSVFPPGYPIPDAVFFASQRDTVSQGLHLLKKKLREGGNNGSHYQVLLFL